MTAVVLDHPLPFVVTWSEEHIEELKRRCQSETYLSIAHHMDRTEGAVRNKCHDLHIKAVGCLWTAGEEQQLVDLQDKSASQAALVLGKTRNAVIGKRHRMGLESKSGLVNGKNQGTRKTRPTGRPRLPYKPRPSEITELPSDVSPFSVSIADLRPGHCRWPVSGGTEFMYCGGGKVDDHSYCARHCRIAFVRPRPAQQRPIRWKWKAA